MASKSLFSSSIGKKFAMALSALFLLVFLLMHLTVNALSVINPAAYNEASFFMSNNPLIQYIMQPILMIGVVYHFVMGFVLEIQNHKARPIKYAYSQGSANSSWASRNMIISGGVILAFLVLHLSQFWIPTIQANYFSNAPLQGNDFMEHLNHVFESSITLIVYIIAFVLLSFHLQHGFSSAFQSIGARHKRYTPFIIAFGKWYSILIPAGFIVIAIYHFVKNL